MRNFARRLIAFDARETTPAVTKVPEPFRSCEVLRLHLSAFVGDAAFRSLLSRSLALSAEEVPWLRAVRVKADGALEGLEELQAQLEQERFAEGGVVLLAQSLGLLGVFIGADVTVRLVCEIWPKVPLNELDFESNNNHEYTK